MTATIHLVMPCGRCASVDTDLLPLVAGRRWRVMDGVTTAYAVATINGRPTFMHHLILPRRPGLITDHRDGFGLNNTRANLRYATHSQNRANTRQRPDRLHLRGVQPSGRGWRAAITAAGRKHFLGRFDTPQEAALAYDAAALSMFGEFATLNFPKRGAA